MKTCVDSYVCSSKMYCHLFSVNNLVVRRRSVKSVCTMRLCCVLLYIISICNDTMYINNAIPGKLCITCIYPCAKEHQDYYS